MAPTKEEQAIKVLRERIADVIKAHPRFDDDLYLLKWLKAHKLKPDNAETLIRKSLKWREKHGYQNLENEPFNADIESKIKVHYNGLTKDGVPVMSIVAGVIDPKGIIEAHGKKAYVKHMAQMFCKIEKMVMDASRKKLEKGKPLTVDSILGIVGLVHAKGYGAKQNSVDVMQCQVKSTKMQPKYFPCIMSHVIVLEMNTVFSALFKLVKPIVENPYLKIDTFDAVGDSAWKSVLSSKFDASTIRPIFGGSMEVDDDETALVEAAAND